VSRTTVHNLIVGKVWLDHSGEMEVLNKTTGDKAKLDFTKCGWFSKGYFSVILIQYQLNTSFHEASGTVYNANGVAT
jgi:hypothetical protein